MKRLVYLSAVAAQALVSLAVLPVLTRALPQEQYGTIALIATSQQLLASVLLLGLAQLVVRSHLRDESIGHGYGTVLVSTAGLAMLAAPVVQSPQVAVPILACLSAVVGICSPLLRAQDRVVAWTTVALAAPAAQVAATVAVVVFGGVTAYLVTWVGALIATVALCRYLGDPVWFRRPRWTPMRELLIIGGPVSFSSLGMLVISSGDRVIVGHAIGHAEAGLYQAFYSLGNLSNFATIALYTFWLNKLMEGDRASIRRFRLEVTAIAMLGAVGAVIGTIILLPDDYDVAANWPIAVIAALVAVPFALTLEFETHLVRMLRTRQLGTVSFTTALGTVAVTLLVALSSRNLIAVALVTPAAYAVLAWRLRRAVRRGTADTTDDEAGSRADAGPDQIAEPITDGAVQP